MNKSTKSCIHDIPEDIIYEIIKYLHIMDAIALCISDPLYVKLLNNWRKISQHKYPTIEWKHYSHKLSLKIDRQLSNDDNLFCMVESSRVGNLEIFDLALSLINLNYTTHNMNYLGYTECINTACERGYINLVMFMFSSTKFIIHDYSPLLSLACLSGNIKLVQFLLKSPKIKPGIVFTKFKIFSPMQNACKIGNLDIVKLLFSIPKGADIYGDTPLSTAKKYGYSEIIKYLEKI